MIIVGDIASPNSKCSEDLFEIFESFPDIFKKNTLVCNLEGLISDDVRVDDDTPILYNHISVLEVLSKANFKAVGLANNHTLDLPENFDATINLLREMRIEVGGASKSAEMASEPVKFIDEGKEIMVFNACWKFLLYHQQNPKAGVYVSELNELCLLSKIARQRELSSSAALVVFLHWSFDLESLPFPMYRQFAKDLIDVGANIVVGCHSHCVQGGERHGDGYIVYGLGNFFVPHNIFAGGRLSFPDFSRLEMVFDWNPSNNRAVCHWFQYQNIGANHTLRFISSDDFTSSELLKEHSPFVEQSTDNYLRYFKINRRKKFLVPVFKDYKATYNNNLFMKIIKNRAKVARQLARLGVRRWQN